MVNLFPHGTGEEGDETGEQYREMIRESNSRLRNSHYVPVEIGLFHDDLEDEGAEHQWYSTPSPVTCKHCGKTNLQWKQNDNGKYWMVNRIGAWHKCSDTNK